MNRNVEKSSMPHPICMLGRYGEERPPSSWVRRDCLAYQAQMRGRVTNLEATPPDHECGSGRAHRFQIAMSWQGPTPEPLADLFYYSRTDARGP